MERILNDDEANIPDSSSARLDKVDRAILSILAQDARLSVREIARRIGMSPGAISERIERLERQGAILGYHAHVNPAAFGLVLEAIIGLQVRQGPPVDETMERLSRIPEVTGVYLVTGQWDLLVSVHVRDQRHLREVLVDRIWQMPSFHHSETLVMLESRRSRPFEFAITPPPAGDSLDPPGLKDFPDPLGGGDVEAHDP